MSRILVGAICGVVFGLIVFGTMIPMGFPDKEAALAGPFLSRFGVGFVIGPAHLPIPGWASGLIFGVLLSLPDSVITKAYVPKMLFGVIGGLVIGVVVERWGI